MKDKNTVFFGGAAGGGKSWFLCESRLINALRFPGYKSFIGRQELKRLMQSTFLTLTKVMQHHGIPQKMWKLNGQYNFVEFSNKSRIDFLDLAYLPSDPLYERFGSLEYTDGAIEEAGEIDFLAYDVLKSRIGRHKNKEFVLKPTMLITGNPKKNWTYTEFYRPWKEGKLPEDFAFIQALFKDNDYTAKEYQQQLAQIKDKSTKERLMFGNWEYDDDPAALINYDAIVDIFTNTVVEGKKYIVADVARYGKDKTVITLWNGLKCYEIERYEKQNTTQTAQKIAELSRKHFVPYSNIIVDEDGVGGGVVDQLGGIKGFIANSQPMYNRETGKPDNYQNLKTQCAYLLADKINNHELAFKTQNEEIRKNLIQELEQIKSKDLDKDGKRMVIPKDEIKEKIGRSPDISDCLLMRMWFELNPITTGYVFIPS